jgi:hypothetical protein
MTIECLPSKPDQIRSDQIRSDQIRYTPLIAPPPEYLQPLDFLLLRHIPSHRGLIEDLGAPDREREPQTRLDAIIVPTFRTPTHLAESARLAARAQTPLIYLCSGEATVGSVFDHLTDSDVDTTNVSAVQLPEGYALPGLHLDTDTFPVPGYAKTKDLATKRNIGLALARMAGLEHVLFLDDDVQGMGQMQLKHMLSGFDHPDRHVVGWSYGSTTEGDTLSSDNSQVVQAYRMLDGEVETFIGGGATAVRLTPDTAFFPDIYNEDWLYYAAMMQQGPTAVARAGDLIHIVKDVFGYGDQEISVEEEFGDTLAEGLFRAQHFDRSLADPHYVAESYWGFIDQLRKGFITKLQESLTMIPDEPYNHINKVLSASHDLHDDTWPGLLAAYTKTWFKDLSLWRNWYNNLPAFTSTSDALRYLDLKEES